MRLSQGPTKGTACKKTRVDCYIPRSKYLHDPRKSKILEDLDPGFVLVDPVPRVLLVPRPFVDTGIVLVDPGRTRIVLVDSIRTRILLVDLVLGT